MRRTATLTPPNWKSAPYKGKIPDEVFSQRFQSPVSDGSGYDRANLLRAMKLLEEAGWRLKNRQLVNTAGQPFRFELLVKSGGNISWTLPFQHSLKRLGIIMEIRQSTVRNICDACAGAIMI